MLDNIKFNADGRSSNPAKFETSWVDERRAWVKRSRDTNVTSWRRGFLRMVSRRCIFFSQPCRGSHARIQRLKDIHPVQSPSPPHKYTLPISFHPLSFTSSQFCGGYFGNPLGTEDTSLLQYKTLTTTLRFRTTNPLQHKKSS